MFATLFFGVLDPSTGTLRYINAGHEPPVVVGAAGVVARLTTTGPAVGGIPNVDFKVNLVQLEPGDVLVSYTDGVTDARNPSGESMTEKRLLALLAEPATSAGELLRRIEDGVQAHIGSADQFDDITLLVLRRMTESVTSAPPGVQGLVNSAIESRG
jgi:sigma-B regulation protein RsbU (phosphoserine phosphatase)